MPKDKVMVGISMHPEALQTLQEAAEVEIYPWDFPQAELRSRIHRFDGMVVYTPDLYQPLFAEARRLRVMACHACSPEMLNAAAQRDIIISVTPTLHETVADMTLALIFAAARNISQVDAAIRRGEWGKIDLKARYSGRDVFGKTLGILGLGRIGAILARRLQGFDMRLLYHDCVRKEALEDALNITYVPLAQLLAEADILIVLVSLNESTYHLLGEAELYRMKRSAILVNTARGAVIDPQALYRALSERWIAAAGLDVFVQEPLKPDDPLLKLDNVVLSPHLGGSTKECDQAMVDDVLRVLRGERPRYPA